LKTVLVTVPVHNEAKLLRSSIETLDAGLAQSGLPYTLSIVEDGSTDETIDVIDELQPQFPNLIVRTSEERLGRGLALRRLWTELDADIYAFVDADLASGPASVAEVVRAVEGGADVATGSRYCPGSVVHRPPLRRLVSMAYNRIVQGMFQESIRDHQCGLKAFSRHALSTLMPLSRENTWAWDTEALILATYSGLQVVEVPIEWTEFRSSRTPLGRLSSDVFLHGESVARLWDRTRSTERRDLPVHHVRTNHVTRKRMGARGTVREPVR
jgi:glycosyltransferase involved in cell wall biosynthesis